MLADRLPAPRPPRNARCRRAGAAGLILALLLGACAQGPAPDSPEATTPVLLVARLPAGIAGFERGPAAPLSGRDGMEVPFNTRGVPAAAAIVQIIPATGDPSDPAPAEAALAGLVRETMQSRTTRRVRDRGARFTLPAEGPARVICAETEGTLGRERVEGLLCAGRFGGSMALIRVTMPQRSPPPADARAFAAGVAVALATPPVRAGLVQPPVGPPVLGAAGGR
jgi:hypothetical protein